MKFMTPFLFTASLSLSALTLTQPATAQSNPKAAHTQNSVSPLLGTWALDLSKMPVPPEARPKSVTITFADGGEGQWSTRVTITAPDGSIRDMTSAYARTGKAVPIEGDRMEADTAAVVTPSSHVMVLALAKDNHPASTRIYVVSKDGKTMTEEAVSWGNGGEPTIRTNIFTRVKM